MPKIYCCLCSRRTETAKQRARVGTDVNWAMLTIHSEKNGLNMDLFSKNDYVCTKCHSIISHYRMKDRGDNKTIKNFEPIAHEPGINKNVLRSFGKSSISKTAVVESVKLEGGKGIFACDTLKYQKFTQHYYFLLN